MRNIGLALIRTGIRTLVLTLTLTRTLAVTLAVTLTLTLAGFAPGRLYAETAALPDLTTAGPGTVIALPGGDYGVLTLKGGGGAPGNPLVIKAADPANPPRFAGLMLDNTADVVLDGLIFKYHFAAGDPIYIQPFKVNTSKDVTIRNTLFDGDVATGVSAVDDGFPYGIGLSVRWCDGFTLQASEIRSFHRGLGISESDNITLLANDIHALRSDGLNLAQVTNLLIEGNYIHDFLRNLASTDHSDMIQFWTTQTTAPSHDITIRDNVLDSGIGTYTQSIFMRNELVDQKKAGPEMFYRNITITGNVIINAHLHGITVGETDGLLIANNTLIANPASNGPEHNPMVFIPQIRVAHTARNVQILRNVSYKIDPAPPLSGWIIARNYGVQNRSAREPGFYDLVFADPEAGDPRNLASFAYRPDGVLAGAGIGAARLDAVNPAIKAGRGTPP